MRLQIGQQIPLLTGNTYSGKEISLNNYLGKPLILSFYRYAGCQLCNLRMYHFIQRYHLQYKEMVQVLAVFQSPVEQIERHLNSNHQLPFEVIADPERHWYKAFGIERSWWKTFYSISAPKLWASSIIKGYLKISQDGPINTIPADFLINKEGLIEASYYGNHIGDHMPFDQIETWIEQQKLNKQ